MQCVLDSLKFPMFRDHSWLLVCVFHQAKLYGDRMRQRIHGFLAVPLFAVSTLAIFTFLGGKTFGFISFYRLIIQGKDNGQLYYYFYVKIEHWSGKDLLKGNLLFRWLSIRLQ